MSIFTNPELLTYIKRVSKSLKLLTNGVNIKYNMVGMLENLELWLNPESISNILSLYHVLSMHRVFMDSAEEERA